MRIRIILLTIALFFYSVLQLSAEILEPVKWTYSINYLPNNEAELIISAKIDKGWHLYSQVLSTDEGPVPTSFNYKKGEGYQLIGKVKEGKPITEKEPVFDNMELSYFANSATFKQKIKINSDKDFLVKGNLEFMVCNDKQCLPPDIVDFVFNVKGILSDKSSADVQAENLENNSAIPINPVQTQLLDPSKWEVSVNKISDSEAEVIITTTLDKGWHIYSQKLPSEDGPFPTKVTFENLKNIELIGDVNEVGNMKSEYDPNFMLTLNFYADKVSFVQKVKILGKPSTLTALVDFMLCDDEKCLPPDTYETEIDIDNSSQTSVASATTTFDSNKMKWYELFIFCFLGGLLVLFTPCVFPMIPMTVSFFTKQSKTKSEGIRNGIWYSLSIVIIYVILGTVVTAIFGYDALNALSTNVWFNIFFFVLLLIFGVSFLGAFEIVLPSSWINKVDKASEKGGMIGIFFMAFTLALVSFSCTGPVVGPLLVQAASIGGSGPIIGMFGFSLALALPFGLFAAFPGWLNTLPKSGGWLVTVKVFLGFIELAFAFKFLSNADLVVQAGLLKRELFIAIWIGVFGALSMYLFGLFRLPHDSASDKLSVGRSMLATLTLIFTIYLIPGMWGAPLKLISGFPPPSFYSESPSGFGNNTQIISSDNAHSGTPEGAHPETCPHGLNCFHDYEQGLAYAKKIGKPVMIDFTGWACVNCRKMEEQVWSDNRVLKRLRENVVLISLYVDEKTELPKDQQIEVEMGGKKKKLKTVGNKWSYLQASKYGTNSQPYYIILNHKENSLIEPAAYDPDIDKFIDWLDRGTAEFEKQKE
jgi:thiol:disulfide interchange protein DsbD